ncbi:MAG TPA: hypothetical protein VG326_17835 [Tepidisphaeraceae bacterium]|jgi:hypothetical protein|nr:hypothetical protein [Tepidisphaeraceae bacterium]
MRKDGNGLRKTITPAPRLKKDWVKIEQPLLEDFLQAEVRRLAVEFQERRERNEIVPPRLRKSGGDRHVNSPFILKNVLWEKNFDCPMHGVSSGVNYGNHRRYIVTRISDTPKSDWPKSHSLNAPLIEQAVLSALQQVLPNESIIRDRIKEFIQDQQRDTVEIRDRMKKLEMEKKKIAAELTEICSLGPNSQDALASRKLQCESRLAEIGRLGRIAAADTLRPDDLHTVVNSVMSQVKDVALSLKKMSPLSLRRLVEVFVPRIIYDSTNQFLEMNVVLPAWAVSKESLITKELGVVGEYAGSYSHHASGAKSLIIAEFGGRRPFHGCFSGRSGPAKPVCPSSESPTSEQKFVSIGRTIQVQSQLAGSSNGRRPKPLLDRSQQPNQFAAGDSGSLKLRPEKTWTK